MKAKKFGIRGIPPNPNIRSSRIYPFRVFFSFTLADKPCTNKPADQVRVIAVYSFGNV